MRGELLRFVVVGAVNTASYYAVYLALSLPLPYLAAHLVAFAAAMVGSFFLNCRFTFPTRPTVRKFLAFPLSTVANLAVSTTALWLLVEVAGLPTTAAPAIAVVLPVPVTFLVSRRILTGTALRARATGRLHLWATTPRPVSDHSQVIGS
jgi:putative flippase GtrA